MRIDVGEKLSITLFLLVLAIILPWYGNAALALFLLLLRMTAPPFQPVFGDSRRRFLLLARYFVLVIIFMTLMNGFLIKGGVKWELPLGLSISSEGIEFGLRTGMRLLAIAAALLLFFGSTTIPQIAQFLQNVGWPVQLVMTLLLTLHFVETLPDRVAMIFTSQEARGAPVRANAFARVKAFLLILSPLLLSAIVDSIDRGMALELRGFHGGSRLTFTSDETQSGRMSAISMLFLTLSALCILGIFLQWLSQ
jgi:energy-coupling factor transporter transmembrane protein EcfT